MALATGQRFGDFEVLGELGRGGMGAVYQARQLSLQRLVALKILPPHMAHEGSTSRFETEAIAAASINHPNIVQVFAAGEESGIRYIAMELVDGESIQARLKRCGRLPLTEALDIAYHVAVALDHAWQTVQLVHRDVKPDNIFLSSSGIVKLGDFGLAKMLRHGATSLTQTGHALGSPHFMSPEQAHGQSDIDFRADIYSLGCALHYMATGRLVFEAPDFLSVILKHINEEPAPIRTYLPDCPPLFEKLLSRVLAKDRNARPQSYAELIEAIQQARHEADTWRPEHTPARIPRQAASPARRNALYAALVMSALLALAGYTYGKRSERSHGAHQTSISLADPSDRADFIASVAGLSAEDRLERVMSAIRERNPAFAGRERYTVEGGVITELTLSTMGLSNIWPLCALPHLRVLHLTGDKTQKQPGNLTDLSALTELDELEEVDCSWNGVATLERLSDLTLSVLRCAHTRVSDLTPVKDMALSELDITGTLVHDVAPLAGMPLAELHCAETRVRDLAPLRHAPLKMVWCDLRMLDKDIVNSWKQIEAVNGMPLQDVLRRVKIRGGK